MRFLKEIVVLVLIIIFLIISDVYVSGYTQKTIEKMDKKMDELIELVLNSEDYSKEEILDKIEKFEDEWKNIEERLAYFAEHNELEKVSVAIVMMKANTAMDMQEDAYEKMKEIKFKIEHIKQKQKFALNNLF